MSELISGKEALIALANGEYVEYLNDQYQRWERVSQMHFNWILNNKYQFRLKPRTISINGIEVPAPFEPNKGDDCRIYVIDTRNICGWDWQHSSRYKSGHIVWRTKSDIKQVVAALQSVLKPQ